MRETLQTVGENHGSPGRERERAMKRNQLAQYWHIVPLIGFLVLASFAAASPGSSVFEPPLLLPLLNTVLLGVLPFIIAFLAATTYARHGSPAFLHFGCGMVALGVGSLFAGWGLSRYGPNFTVTVHNVGCLLGGLCHLGAVWTLTFWRPAAHARLTHRAAALVTGYAACALVLLAVSALTTKGFLPAFFLQNQGPTPIRQVLLAVAAIAYALSAVAMVDVHARTGETLFRLYGSALFLMAIGLGIVLSEKRVGSLLSWTGRAAQYAGSLYFMAAVVVGQRKTGRIGVSLPAYLHELLSSYIDGEVSTRTSELVELSEKLRVEISEREHAEGELRRNEARLRLAAEATGFGFYDYGFEAGDAYYSPEFLHLFGLPPDATLELDGDLVAKAVHPADRAGFLSRMSAANEPAGSGMLDHEYRIIRAEGAVRWLKVRGRTTFRGSGEAARPSRANGIVQDITDRRLVEQELKESEESYRTAIEGSLQGVSIMQNGKIVLCNEALCRMNGYSKEEAYRLAPEEVVATVHPEDRARAIQAMMVLQRGESVPPAAVLRLIDKTGGLHWVEMMAARSMYRGSPAIQLSYVDVTERHRAEESYHLIVDHSSYGMAVVQDGRIIFANHALAELTGNLPSQLLGLTTEQLVAFVHEEDKDRVVSYMTRLVAGSDMPTTETFRFANVDKEGKARWVEVQSARIDRDGSPALQMSFKDVSLEKSAEERLTDARLKMRNLAVHLLHVREEERREIAREIHDELGQPLAALKMDMHWLQKRLFGQSPAVDERLKGMVEMGENAIGVAQRIASDLRPRMLDDLGLASAIKQLGADFTRRTKIACTVTADVAEDVVGGNAATTLYRFAQESLSNIALHSWADHAAIHLSTAAGELVLQIEDDGIGIPPERARAPESYGLIGLRERVEGLGGSLSIWGEAGFGTILTARIPLSKGSLG